MSVFYAHNEQIIERPYCNLNFIQRLCTKRLKPCSSTPVLQLECFTAVVRQARCNLAQRSNCKVPVSFLHEKLSFRNYNYRLEVHPLIKSFWGWSQFLLKICWQKRDLHWLQREPMCLSHSHSHLLMWLRHLKAGEGNITRIYDRLYQLIKWLFF